MSDIDTYIGNAAAFPVLAVRDYFNHAGISPLPGVAADALRQFVEDFSLHGPLGERQWFNEPSRYRVLQAELLNAAPEEIAIVKNTGEGISAVAAALDWKAGDRVVVLAEEYPANVYPWMNATRPHGVEVITLPLHDRADGARVAEMDELLREIEHPRTRLVSMSHVHWATGQLFDLARIGTACRERGVLFGVDAIQSHGAVPIDVAAMQIDFLWAGGHKWQLGTPGVGVFYCRGELIEQLPPMEVGWFSVVNPMDWGTINFNLKPDASRFECGTPGLSAIVAANPSLELLLEVDVAAAFGQVQLLNAVFREGLQQKGYRLFTPAEAVGGHTVFVHPDRDPEAQFKTLQKEKIELASRLGRLRFAPHFYNTMEQVERLVAHL